MYNKTRNKISELYLNMYNRLKNKKEKTLSE